MKKRQLLNNWHRLLILLPLFMMAAKVQAQTPVTADPALGSFDITTQADAPVNANTLTGNVVYKLKLVVINNDQAHSIPEGTAYIRIGLGSKMIVDPAFNLATAPLNDHFSYSVISSVGQSDIYCLIHTDLPASYAEEMVFNVRVVNQGASTVSGNFLIFNNNPAYTLSDNNSGNNTASLQYQVVANAPLPVTITKFTAATSNCRVSTKWSTAQETSLSRYELEASKDGASFVKVAEVAANGQSDYNAFFNITDALKAPVLQLRLKSIDLDGQFKYSNIITVNATCTNKVKAEIYSFPNPLTGGSNQFSIALRGDVFKGNYKLSLTDISGKVYSVKDVTLNNVSSFQFDPGCVLAKGKYFVRMQKADGAETNTLQFEKL